MKDASGHVGGGTPDPTDKQIVADRFATARLAAGRFINVIDGKKKSINHDTRHSDPTDVPGRNYGVYAGGGLVDIDIDDYEPDADESGLEAILALPETLTAESPHTDGEPGGHRYYRVSTDRSLDDCDADAVLASMTDKTADAARNDPVALALAEAFGTPNPQPSWGEVRTVNQYVVGPGSQLDGCNYEWCDECADPDGGRYTIANDAPIATITVADLVDALKADPTLASHNHSTADDASGTSMVGGGGTGDYDPVGTAFETVVTNESKIATYLAAGAKAAGFDAADGGNDRSKADWYVCCTAIEYGVPETDVHERLTDCDYSKVGAPDAAHNYWRRTWSRALTKDDVEPNSQAPATDVGDGDTDLWSKFVDACDHYQIDSGRVAKESRDGETVKVGVSEIVPDTSIADAVLTFNRKANVLDGIDRQAVIGYVILLDLQEHGEFFKTSTGELYYFHDPETHVYRVDGDRRVLTEDFQALVWERYNLFAGRFSRNLGKDIKSQARRLAPERAVYRFAYYDTDAGALYVTDFGDGYYAVTPGGVGWRQNGTDVFFLPKGRAEPFEYVAPTNRPDLPAEIPGERPLWCGHGDAIMRLFGNRVNYDEHAALAPADQRNQLYIHLHTLPFIDVLNARPIMAWVGEKGSGKTVLQRSIGRFIYGEVFTESVMPDSKDDFLAKVSNQALAFLDNYDDGVTWANDILAAVATGAGIDLRELYTTNALHQEVPRCWLSLTSRNPPFRRDDVADRTLVFRVERVEDGFVGMGDYLRQVTAYRNLLWSVYLDNLQAIVQAYHERDTGAMSSDHRMADWAIFARIVGDVLDVPDVDELLETMEIERATFALENEAWARVLGRWIEANPDAAAEYRGAGDLADALASTADDADLPLDITHAAGLGSKLTTYREELGELYDLEIDDSERSNQYRFATDDDGHDPTGLGRYA